MASRILLPKVGLSPIQSRLIRFFLLILFFPFSLPGG
nr:MAG TPA: hypothetical protein [Caudoviricetes sp.]